MKINFTTEQKIVISMNLTVIAMILYFYSERRKDMKSNEIAIPDFLKKNINTNTKQIRGLEIEPERETEMKPFDSVEEKEDEIILEETVGKESDKVCMAPPKETISTIEKEKLSSTVKSMGKDQVEVMLDNVPIELVFNHIGKELERNKTFAKAIENAMNILQY